MRKLSIGAVRPGTGGTFTWSPRYRLKKHPILDRAKTGQKNTTIMSYFPTWKGGRRHEPLRHYFHADMALLLEMDPDVVHWTTGLNALTYDRDRKRQEFTPNFNVEERSGRRRTIRLIRAAANSRAKREERFAFVQGLYADLGVVFEHYTDKELSAHPRLKTAKALFFHRYWDVPDDLPFRAAEIAAVRMPNTLGELHERLGGAPETWPCLLSLIAQGYIEVDIDAALVSTMPVRKIKLTGWA